MILTWVMIYPSMCKNYDIFPIKIATQFALFSEKFTRLTKILHNRQSHRSRQISTLMALLDKSLIENQIRLFRLYPSFPTFRLFCLSYF